jgi:prevent-host-death family protein
MPQNRTTRKLAAGDARTISASRKPPSYTATQAKNEFGQILERAIRGDAVIITRHDAPKAVLISIDEYNALKKSPELKLDELSAEFDAMFETLQTARARKAMDAAFHASPKQMGAAAVKAARKRV